MSVVAPSFGFWILAVLCHLHGVVAAGVDHVAQAVDATNIRKEVDAHGDVLSMQEDVQHAEDVEDDDQQAGDRMTTSSLRDSVPDEDDFTATDGHAFLEAETPEEGDEDDAALSVLDEEDEEGDMDHTAAPSTFDGEDPGAAGFASSFNCVKSGRRRGCKTPGYKSSTGYGNKSFERWTFLKFRSNDARILVGK